MTDTYIVHFAFTPLSIYLRTVTEIRNYLNWRRGILVKLKSPVQGHIWPSGLLDGSASHPSPAPRPRFHTFICSLGDLLYSQEASPSSHFHRELPGARVNLAPTVFASVLLDILLSSLTSMIV
jgi:hypothetical protein